VNLVIGNTSQQSFYYPDSYIRISSRNIDFDFLKSNHFDSVYITFAEQRVYEKNINFIEPNYLKTIDTINSIIDKSNKIVIFTTCELWSNKTGKISIDTELDFNLNNRYAISKMLLWDEIKRLRLLDSKYNKVVIVHPFNFISTHRSKYFLFGKIFDSIVNRKRITVNDLDVYRDIIHTKFLVDRVIEAGEDIIIGSGYYTNIKKFIIDLYDYFNLDFNELVSEDRAAVSSDKPIRADVSWNYSYDDLLSDTIIDIENFKAKQLESASSRSF
jgi:hypothetical protein